MHKSYASGSPLFEIDQTMKAMRDPSGHWDTTYTAGDLLAIDPQSGFRLTRHAMENHPDVREYLFDINVAPDGKCVFVARNDERGHWWTEAFDALTLQPIAEFDHWRVFITRQRDGQPIVLANQPNTNPMPIGAVNTDTFQVMDSWSLESQAQWVSP